MSSKLKDLLAQREAIDRQIEEAKRNQRADAVAQVKALMAEHGLTLVDLSSRRGAAKPRSGGKVAPKYRDAAGNTWTGRGLRPTWLKAA